MPHIRRWASFVGIAGFALMLSALWTNTGTGFAKKKGVPLPAVKGTPENLSSVRIIENGDFRRIINVGRDCIKDKDWKQAVQALQAVLEETNDYYVRITDTDAAGNEVSRWTSVKFEANNLIGSMPADGLEEYEVANGKKAKDLLDEAKEKGDREKLADIAQRFCHTKAGIEANELLATLYLARGQVFTAALKFEKLLSLNPERAKISDLTLFKAALAFRRAGDAKNHDETWKRLEANLAGKAGLVVGDNTYTLARLKDAIDENAVTDIINLHDWARIRGNNTNNAQASGSPPLLDTKIFSRQMFNDKTEGIEAPDNDGPAEARVRTAMKQVSDANQPVLPGFFPIASQGVMVYRSYRDIRAVALSDREIREDGNVYKVKQGEILWKNVRFERSLSMLLEENKTRVKTEQWLGAFEALPGLTSFLYENSVVGTLSTDNRLVYAIDDLAVPPHTQIFQPFAFNNPQFNADALKPLLTSNELHAYDLQNGKLTWFINGTTMPEFKDSHFLCQPISVGGKLYVLNEKVLNINTGVVNPGFGGVPNQFGGESQLRLVCIDPDPKKVVNGNPQIVGKPQELGNVLLHNRFIQDMGRRVNAVHLGFGEGILVCPTNAGEVFGIDLMTRSLVWSYPYRESAPPQVQLPGVQFQPNPFPQPIPKQQFSVGGQTLARWKPSPPSLQDGKVVFAAQDADSVHCISLRDGKQLWTHKQAENDQYMAGVYQGRVLIVGKTNIRALSLKDGSQVWSTYTGDLPSGQGVASKGIYYLPLRKGEILAVDIEKGTIKAHNRAAIPGVVPGNLIFAEGMVLTQTPTEVVAYPQLSARLAAAKLDSGADPENLAKLTDYGELLLKDGQVHLAVETLLKIHDKNPADPVGRRVKERLFEALTDLMQVDFNKASQDHLPIYKALCVVPGNPAEEQARKAKFFRLVGQGREAQGNLVEAFQMYKDFGSLPIHNQGGIASPEDPNQKTPVNVWLRGRIAGMFAKATEQQRAPLEAKIAEEWKLVEAKKNADEIRSFVGMFDVPFKVGREARIRLAEAIMDKNERSAFLEAELYLHQVMGSEYRTDPQTGGRALAALALLEEKKGTVDSMRLAAAYYRDLMRDFAQTPVRGTRTGADLLNELAADKRFLPFLEDAGNPWGPVKIAARSVQHNPSFMQSSFVMQPEGDNTPFARNHRVMLDPSNAADPRVRLRDIVSNQDRWSVNLGSVPMNQQIFFHMYQQASANQGYFPNARFRFYHVKGHLIVCQIGVMVYCVDGDTGKKLWEMQTVENIQAGGVVHLQNVMNDQEGNPELMYWNQLNNQRFRVTLGRIGSAQASYVAVLSHKGLTVVDPLRGTTLWKKPEIAVNSHVFGDDQYLFLIEGGDSGNFGAGRTLRASDGEVMADVPDFRAAYQGRVRVMGRKILAFNPSAGGVSLHLYDIVSGKDAWSKAFPAGSFVLQSEDRNIAGVIDTKGNLTVVDANTGKELLTTSLVQGRISPDDLRGLVNPLLLGDAERFYVALNRPVDSGKVNGGALHNNFNNGTRCQAVNGWFLAVHRQDGQKKVGEREIAWKKGDLAWHSYMPMQNQMIVLEQFEQLPIVLFTVRYNEILPNGANKWSSVTQSLHKVTGKMVFDSGPMANNSAPAYSTMQVDLKSRTVNLIGFGTTVQHYVDDGTPLPPLPQGAMLAPETPGLPQNVMALPPNGVFPPGMLPPNGRLPINRGIGVRVAPIAPPMVLENVPKR